VFYMLERELIERTICESQGGNTRRNERRTRTSVCAERKRRSLEGALTLLPSFFSFPPLSFSLCCVLCVYRSWLVEIVYKSQEGY
jgi:hypothetical protein